MLFHRHKDVLEQILFEKYNGFQRIVTGSQVLYVGKHRISMTLCWCHLAKHLTSFVETKEIAINLIHVNMYL